MDAPQTTVELDLCGEVCPYTFLRTKLALEELQPGDHLTILLDHPPAFRNVPQALEEDGHLLLRVTQDREAQRCTILVRKGS